VSLEDVHGQEVGCVSLLLVELVDQRHEAAERGSAVAAREDHQRPARLGKIQQPAGFPWLGFSAVVHAPQTGHESPTVQGIQRHVRNFAADRKGSVPCAVVADVQRDLADFGVFREELQGTSQRHEALLFVQTEFFLNAS
jgi:hypothetical protein